MKVGPDKQRVVFDEFELDRAHRKLYRDGEVVSLYAKTFDLLDFLVRHNGSVVMKNQILEEVWADQFVEEANLSVQISALRKALGETKNEPRFLVTVPGVGYKFVAPVEPDEAEIVVERQTLERTTLGEDIPELDEPSVSLLPGESSRRWKFIAMGGILAAAVAVTAFAFYWFYSAPRRISSVAVLPFASQTATPDAEYLSEGLAESVIHTLSTFPELRVMSRNSSFRYRGSETDTRTIGRDLGVDTVLTGRIVPSGDSLAIRAELISTADNSVIWGEEFKRQLDDVERLRTDIARSIADRLRLKLSAEKRERLDRDQTTSAEAYKLYLLGRYHLNRFNDEGFQKGREYFQQAIDKDPNYALAHTGLAEAYNRLCGYNVMPSSECFPKSRASSERAIELDEVLAEPHATLGSVKHFYDWDWAGAEKELRRAIELDPNDSYARQLYSYFLTGHGRFEESLAEMRLASDLDPLSAEKAIGIAEILYFQKRYDEALTHAQKVTEMDPNAGFVVWMIGNIYLQKGMLTEAIAHYERSIPLSGDSPDERASLAYGYALAGRKDDARRILADLQERSKSQFISPCVLAIVYAGLDDKDKAFEQFERAYSGRDFMLTLLKIEPAYDRLRDDPRYADLMRRVGF